MDLDERPLRADNEINPDVLGYIFEKYINQKQMGAYYTKEDITEYISKSTVLPFLFDAARAKCKVAFENPNGPTIWDLLRENPDRYIYDPVKKGVEIPVPKDMARQARMCPSAAVEQTRARRICLAHRNLARSCRSAAALSGRREEIRQRRGARGQRLHHPQS